MNPPLCNPSDCLNCRASRKDGINVDLIAVLYVRWVMCSAKPTNGCTLLFVKEYEYHQRGIRLFMHKIITAAVKRVAFFNDMRPPV